MAESEEALQLKRRARRRLVGALALVTFVVIILPLLLDKEPGPAGPPLDVQIPKPEAGGFASRVGPTAAAPLATPEKKAEAPPATPEPTAVNPEKSASKSEPSSTKAAPAKAAPAAVEKTVAAPAKAAPAVAEKTVAAPAKAADKAGDKAEQERAQAALRDEAWVVALDAFSDAKNVNQLRAKLSSAGVKSYTELVKTSKGELTRVRAGPFGSKEAAEQARAKLEAMGLKPGAVASR